MLKRSTIKIFKASQRATHEYILHLKWQDAVADQPASSESQPLKVERDED